MATSSPEEFRMSLFEHLAELRGRLLRVTIAVVVLGAISLGFARQLYGLLMLPVLKALPPESAQFVYTSAIEEINVLMKMGLYAGVFLSTPILLWQLWAFVAPGLYDDEKKLAGPFVFAGTVAFLGGAAFCYFVVLPSMFQFLLQHEEVTSVTRSVDTARLREEDALRYLRLGDYDRAGAAARSALGDLGLASSDTAGAMGVRLVPKEDVEAREHLAGLGRLIDATMATASGNAKASVATALLKHEEAVKAFTLGDYALSVRLAKEGGASLTSIAPERTQELADLWRLEEAISTGATSAEAANWTKPMLSMSEQLGLVLVLELAFGVIFQLPLVMAALGLVGLVTSAFLFKYQRHALVVCLILAAVLTPTGDAINLALMAGPMMACYELGVLFVWLVERRRAKMARATALAAPPKNEKKNVGAAL